MQESPGAGPSTHRYGVYGEAVDQVEERAREAGVRYPLSHGESMFNSNNQWAIDAARRAWSDGLPIHSVILWWKPDTTEEPHRRYYSGGWAGLYADWSLVLSTISAFGWKIQSWNVQMETGGEPDSEHYGVALFVRPTG